MRTKGIFTGTIAACLLVLLVFLPFSSVVLGDITPFDSDPVHEAGYLNAVFTDTYGKDIPLTVFYPATTEGEDASGDLSGAPYPTIALAGHERAYPAMDYYTSYGIHLSKRGYVVLMANMSVHEGVPGGYGRMANTTLDALEYATAESVRAGSPLLSMVNSSAMARAPRSLSWRLMSMAGARSRPFRAWA